MGAQDINTVQALPEQTFYSSKPGIRLFADQFNSGRAFDSVTGKRSVGLMDPKDGKFSLKPEFSDVTAGAIDVVLEKLVKGYNGNFTGGFTDLNPNAMQVANGTTIDMVDVQPTSPIVGNTNATGSTVTMLKMATGDAADFAGHEGEVVLVPRTDTTALPMRGLIQRVDAGTDSIYLAYPLDEVPKASAQVALLEGFEQDLGGNVTKFREFILAQDFLNGASHRTIIWRGQAIGGFDQTLTNDDKTKTMIDVQILGYSRQSAGAGNTFQIVPATIKGTYGKANI